jgi:hypothetical protein
MSAASMAIGDSSNRPSADYFEADERESGELAIPGLKIETWGALSLQIAETQSMLWRSGVNGRRNFHRLRSFTADAGVRRLPLPALSFGFVAYVVPIFELPLGRT